MLSTTLPFSRAAAAGKKIPVGLELYSVRDELAKDLTGTILAVAKMGYQVLEFYAPYYSWNADRAKEVRKLMDDSGVRCNSTHNGAATFTPEGINKAIELNQILGAKYVVWASAGKVNSVDGWKWVADTLTQAAHTLKPHQLRTGYHNHKLEFMPLPAEGGQIPMRILAAHTPKDVMLQLDVGTCVEAGADPVAWIKSNKGRINSIHCKEWGAGAGANKDKGYRTLLGEGEAPWKRIFDAAESAGGIEYYLIEQEGSRFSPLETAEKCLATFKKMRA